MGLDAIVPCDCPGDAVCGHDAGILAHRRVGNWHAVRTLRHLTRESGPERFPAVLGALPSTNDGGVDAARVPHLMEELRDLRGALAELPGYRLVDTGTGHVIAGPVEEGGLIRYERGVRFTLGENGMSQWTRDGIVVFEASMFTEEALSAESPAAESLTAERREAARLLVPATGAPDTPSLLYGGVGFADRVPALLRVERVPLDPSTTALDALIEICVVAQELGRGILWA